MASVPSGRSAGNTSGRLQEDSRRKASGRYLRKEGLRKVPQEVLRKASKECLRKASIKSKYQRSADDLNGTLPKSCHLEHHGPSICIEIGARANRRRAEGCLYVWETAFTVQRALCTFIGKGHPVQRALRTFMGKGTMAPI